MGSESLASGFVTDGEVASDDGEERLGRGGHQEDEIKELGDGEGSSDRSPCVVLNSGKVLLRGSAGHAAPRPPHLAERVFHLP